MSKYVALDFGAESGRAMVGAISNNEIVLEEVYRFANRQVQIGEGLHWDILHLFFELKKGLSLAAQKYKTDIKSIGIDTWGVDFGLIDKNDNLIGNPFCYRDSRTDGMLEAAFKLLPKEKFYHLTGNEFMQINTAFQLLSMVQTNSPLLSIADKMLFIPDLLAFFLTGEKVNEYTISSTSQLLNPVARDWQAEVFSALNIPQSITNKIVHPGTIIGAVRGGILAEINLQKLNCIAVGSHDTASAVAAIPAQGENWAFLSSGTWSLMGIESDMPILTQAAFDANFTNEGGVGNKIRFLKNITGMWMLQQAKRHWEANGIDMGYVELTNLATQAKPFVCFLDVDNPLFAGTSSMITCIDKFCEQTNQTKPQNTGEYVKVILEGLAFKYRLTLDQIKICTGRQIDCLHVVGGGSQNKLLNQLTANTLQIPVKAGPVEATALGNIIMQAIANKELNTISEGRLLIEKSTPVITYMPESKDIWEEKYTKYKKFKVTNL